MLDPVFDCLDMAEHHRRARVQPEFVRDLHHFQPCVGLAFQRRDSLAHAVDQNLATAAGNRSQPGFLELRDHFAQRHAEDFGEMLELRRTESVNVDVRIFLPDVMQQIEIPVEWQASDDARPASGSERRPRPESSSSF